MLRKLFKKISVVTISLLVLQLMSFGLGVGTKGALAAVDAPPVGGQLTWSTTNHPGPNTITSPSSGVYSLATPLMQSDVFQSLEVIVTDDTAMDISYVPVLIDGIANGVMEYTGAGNLWEYSGPSTPITFTQGAHGISATFSDMATTPQTTILTVSFITDGQAPTITQLVNETFKKGPSLPGPRLVTGTDETLIGDLCYQIVASPMGTVGEQCVAPEIGSTTSSSWNIFEIFQAEMGVSDLNGLTNGIYDISYYVKDAAGYVSVTDNVSYTIEDATVVPAPTINPVVTPTNQPSQKLTGTKEANSSLWLNGTQIVAYGADTSWEFVMTLVEGENMISLVAKDETGNSSTPTETKITKITVAPTMVQNFVVSIDGSGNVILSWTNPSGSTYAGIRVLRDGAPLVSLDPSATSFVDLTAEKGKTYFYQIAVFDSASNESITTPFYVSVPVPPSNLIASAGISDSGEITSAAASDSKEVKGDDKIDLGKTDDNKKEDENLPWWGIILLIVLVLVGAYLLFTQRPKNEPPRPEPVMTKPKSTPKKTIKK